MAERPEYSPVTKNENINYEARLPSAPVALGLLMGATFSSWTPQLQGYPLTMGLKRFLIPSLTIGGGLGLTFQYLVSYYNARKRTFVQEYVEKHPQDFVKPTPQKYSEILMEWHPVRV